MTKEEAAAKLDGCEHGEEGAHGLWAAMKAAGLVALYGGSDDLMDFSGAISVEIGAYHGGRAYVTRAGRASDRRIKGSTVITAVWYGEGEPCWTYSTAIPHATFDVVQGGEPYCRGIVFALADVPPHPPA